MQDRLISSIGVFKNLLLGNFCVFESVVLRILQACFLIFSELQTFTTYISDHHENALAHGFFEIEECKLLMTSIAKSTALGIALATLESISVSNVSR